MIDSTFLRENIKGLKEDYYKDIPTKVEEGIKKQEFRPKVVKFTDSGTYLITDGDKRRGYYM